MHSNKLFAPFKSREFETVNRIVMAPMTRSRAGVDGVPSALAPVYYAQRSSAGLIITEGVQPSAAGQGYSRTPGIHSRLQIESWSEVARAVHGKKSKIFMQIMHVGRIAHPLNKQNGALTIAPSDVPARVHIHTDQSGLQPTTRPRALLLSEIAGVIEEYKEATRNAFLSEMDGVELHAGSGYLPMQFMTPGVNRRTDQYGGSPSNRCRFVLECLEEMASVKGPGRVGIKIAPGITFNDVHDPDPEETYAYLLSAIEPMKLAYLHLQRPVQFLKEFSDGTDYKTDWLAFARRRFSGPIISGGDYDGPSAELELSSGRADLIAFGRSFIANPDLPLRLLEGFPIAQPDPASFYAPGAQGYIDYPMADGSA